MPGILILADHDAGTFKSTALELVGKARELGGPVAALAIGTSSGEGLPADLVLTVDGPDFATFNTIPWVDALAAAVAKVQPEVILATANMISKDVMPRLAARLGVGMASDVVELKLVGGAVVGRRPVYAGKALYDVTVKSSPAIFTARPNSFVPVAAGAPGGVEVLAVAAGASLTTVVETLEPAGDVVDLTEAHLIVSGGRAVKSAEGFDELIRPLAAAIGASPGASRAAVDAGFCPHSEQVGQTGKVVNPSLYIACGISGAIQHLAGMRTSKVIVAINKDPDAPIFQFATYGIVGDIFTVCPMLTEALK
jgi:electron transfer flavoprotein alpha subunit